MSRSHELARRFRAAYGTSPRHWLMRPLAHARAGLASGAASVIDVTLDVGFADQSHRTRVFKAAFSVAPIRYRGLAGQ